MTEWNQRQLLGKVKNSARSLDPVTGTTENTAVEAIDLDTRQNRDTVLTISNTGTKSLYYSIKVRNDYVSGADFTVFSNEITTADKDEAILVRHARVFVDIQSHVTDQHTTYSITAIGGT